MLRTHVRIELSEEQGTLTLIPVTKEDEAVLSFLLGKRHFVSVVKKENNGGSWILTFSKEDPQGKIIAVSSEPKFPAESSTSFPEAYEPGTPR